MSGEDRAFGSRQVLLHLVQEAGQYPKSSRQPIQNFEQGFHAQIALKKASLPQAAGQTMCGKHQDCWCLSRRETRVTWPRELTVLMERRNRILLRLRRQRGEA